MAGREYKLKKGITRTPEEHRDILDEIDELQRISSAKGVQLSHLRILSAGCSATKYKSRRKSTKPLKSRIHPIERFARE